jgi:uncharacterized membrane protein YqhA
VERRPRETADEGGTGVETTDLEAREHRSKPGAPPPFERLKRAFERVLWESRLVVIVAVVVSVLLAFGAFYMATADAVTMLRHLAPYGHPDLSAAARDGLRKELVTDTVNAVDGYLFGAIMLIFGMGLYKLFIGKIPAAEAAPLAPHLLRIDSLDDLKDRLAKVVLLVMVIEFFQHALETDYDRALDLLYLALGILLVAAALYLTSHKPPQNRG